MNKRKALLIILQVAAVLSAAVAFVIYRMSSGGGGFPGDNCLLAYFIAVVFSFWYLFFCIHFCPADGKDGGACTLTCFFHFLIIQVVLLVALVACLFGSGAF
jgi:hypothetical protein